MKKILILNGSLGAGTGNTDFLIEHIQTKLKTYKAATEVVHLKELLEKNLSLADLKTKLTAADGFIFTSGTYWDSWGSPMQYFLETSTEFEGTDLFLGKPAAVLITMHSVGGKGVLSRLQGVLNTIGIMIPPMTGIVYSLAGKLALETESTFADDFWGLEDLNVIAHNLMTCLNKEQTYKPWAVDRDDPKRVWIK